jgi:F-type H+-transporting ATPase subunit delta
VTELAKRYGGAFYELAAEEGLELRLLEEVDFTVSCFREEPDYLRLLSAPNLPKKERCGLLDEAFGSALHPYTVNFLKLLCEEGILRELSGCARVYRTCYNKAHDVLEVTATSAAPLDEAAQEKLKAKLSASTGKTIDLTVKVDPALLGGIRLDMDGVQVDGSVRHRLDTLRRSISDVVM